jgi:hypothetical protein
MNKKAKAQLLSELAQLDVERQAMYTEFSKECSVTDTVLKQFDAFRASLCEVLGIHNIGDVRIENFTTEEPILGGDEGVTTIISYYLGALNEDTCEPYLITMSYEGLQVQYTAPMAVDLPTMLHRGYAALRVLRKGTINYHKS